MSLREEIDWIIDSRKKDDVLQDITEQVIKAFEKRMKELLK